jgi:hypothetical protein
MLTSYWLLPVKFPQARSRDVSIFTPKQQTGSQEINTVTQ